MKRARDGESVWFKLAGYNDRSRNWTLPRLAILAVAVAIVSALSAVVNGSSVGLSAVALAASFVALVLLIASDALGYFR